MVPTPYQTQNTLRRKRAIYCTTTLSKHDLLRKSRYESNHPNGKCFANESKEIAVNKGHMSALQLKHAELETKLDTENARPCPDDNLIHHLKKRKLHLKDQMRLETVSA
jgi:hypothetical protein